MSTSFNYIFLYNISYKYEVYILPILYIKKLGILMQRCMYVYIYTAVECIDAYIYIYIYIDKSYRFC